MPRGNGRRVTTSLALAAGTTSSGGALAQKPGGILRIYNRDTPAGMSILEEVTISAEMPMMGVFNNLVEFDQHTLQTASRTLFPTWQRAGPGIPRGPS
jgi:peptide/nickel transport system substrate-binding protein